METPLGVKQPIKRFHIFHKSIGIVASFLSKDLRDKCYGSLSNWHCAFEICEDPEIGGK